ncbi:MAG: hypothetical protein WBA48_10960 [Xanthobacteraceae bacterium]
MITSQTLAVLGSLVVLLPVAFTALPSGFNPHSAGQRDDAWYSGSEIDHHQIVDASLAPYSAIGKFKGTMTCTAAIVLNPRIIITAGHCVAERDGTTRKSNFSFHLAYQAGADLGPFQATGPSDRSRALRTNLSGMLREIGLYLFLIARLRTSSRFF